MLRIDISDVRENRFFWSGFFRAIDRSFKLEYANYNNRKYMCCTTNWYEQKKVRDRLENAGIKICHKDHECDGYFDDECKFKKYQKNNKVILPDEIKYMYGGTFNYEGELDDEDDKKDDEDDLENKKKENKKKLLEDAHNKLTHIQNLIKNNSNYDGIIFDCNYDIEITNECGFNDDHRGSDHTIIKLPFVDKVEIGSAFTLKKVLDAYFNLKSHKFDKWYELYCTADAIKSPNEKIEIQLNFDHGS